MGLSRVRALRAWMETHHISAYLVTDAVNRRYISGFTGTSGAVLITQNRAFLLTDFRYREQAPRQAPDFEIMEHSSNIWVTLHTILRELALTELAFEQHHVTVGQFQELTQQLNGISLIPSSSGIHLLRMIKDKDEIRIIEQAAALADQTFQHLLTKIQPGVSEQEIALEIEFFIRKHGGTSTSFDTIVASGERSAMPHGVASDRRFQVNEYIKLDFGAYFQGYCSDLTRTVMLGKPTKQHRDIYQIVLEAQMNVLEHLQPGMTGQQADALARDVITHYGYGDYFGHGTGHGLGMEIHESPRLNRLDTTVLKPGMVVTVEPGIYLPGFGGVRIEDDVLLTETGIQILTHATKECILID